MGAGKTTVGRELSQSLGWQFIDLDDVVVRRANQSVPEIFASEGEAGFRKRESQALQEVLAASAENATVIALGGGAYVQGANFELIRRSGCRTFHLDADLETLMARCKTEGNTRPLLQDENHFRQLYVARQSSYMKADHRIDTAGKSVREIVTEIMLQLGISNELRQKSGTR